MNLDRRLIQLAGGQPLALSLTLLLGLSAGVLTVVQASTLSRVIEAVFLEHASRAGVRNGLVMLLVIFSGRAVLAWGSELSAKAAARRVKASLRRMIFDHLLKLGPAYTTGERTGELTNTALEGIESLEAYFSQYLPQLVLAALVPLTFLTFVFPLDWVSGAVLLVTAPLIPVFMLLIGNLAQALTRRQWQTLSRLSAYFLDVLQGLTTLKLLGRSRDQTRVIAQVSDRFRQTTLGVLRVTFLSALVLEMVATLSTAVIAVEIGLRLLYGRLGFEQAFFILLLAPEFYLPLRLLGSRFHAGMSGVAAAKRIFEILETAPQSTPGGSATKEILANQSDQAVPAPPFTVEFDQVAYTYVDRQATLQGVSFSLFPGKKVALVGPSGAGKSSLAQILLRFIEPQAGQVRINGVPLAKLDPHAWRAHLAWVPQSPYLFHATIAANIRLAHPEASLEQVVRAAQLAHADEFIRRLPQGYDTLIGEHGARLSGGQAQRIALARAFLKDAPLLILDEATANLDPEHEALITEAVERLLVGRTALIIAHRLSTIYSAHQILVMDRGCIVARGTHEELAAQPGLYRRLRQADLQSPGASPTAASPAFTPGTESSLPHQAPLPASTPEGSTQAGSLAVFTRLLGFLAPFKRWVALSVLLGFATVASSMGLMTASAYIISAAALHPSIAALQVAIVGVRFFGISRGVFRYLERYSAHQVTFRLLADLRVWFYRALEPLAPARLLRYRSGDLLARILGDITSLENFYVRVIAPPLTALAVMLLSGLFLARFDWWLAAALLGLLGLGGIGLPWLVYRLSREPGRQIVQQTAQLSTCLVDGIQGMADLCAYNQENRQAAQIELASDRLSGAQRQAAWINGLQSAAQSLLANLGMWVVLYLAIPLVSDGRLDGVYLAVLALAALTSFEAIQPLPLAAQYLESNLEAARRLFELVDAEPAVQDPPAPLRLPERIDLQIRALSFTYPALPGEATANPPALTHLDLDLPAGKHVALVGPSGAGKSTLIALLLRFWDYRQGEIRLNGKSLKCFAADEWRSRIAVVSQHTYLFSASLRDNLLVARPQASQAELTEAARQAQIHDFILSLPQGYDTWIGEQGLRLSAGERQRVAIARALLKNAPILILDEATANLDTLTEQRVSHELHCLMEGRTSLIITHRLSGLEDMDEILVLHEGQIRERGTHAALIATGGLYQRMWSLQRAPWLLDASQLALSEARRR